MHICNYSHIEGITSSYVVELNIYVYKSHINYKRGLSIIYNWTLSLTQPYQTGL